MDIGLRGKVELLEQFRRDGDATSGVSSIDAVIVAIVMTVNSAIVIQLGFSIC